MGGLRGGSLRVSPSGTLSFVSYEYVPGVTLSGAVPDRGTAVVRVRGSKAARGTLRISISGVDRHAGRPARARGFAAAAGVHRAVADSVGRAVRRGSLIRGLG